jgi:hypothetical protein
MRLLVDEYLAWTGREAWASRARPSPTPTTRCCPRRSSAGRWTLFGRKVLPRHLEIIYEINARFLDEVRIRFFGDEERLARMSLIDESGERYVRMAHLACVGSHAINGVAALHTELLKSDVLRDFYDLWPQKFSNKTNGVTPRRWMALSNPRLTQLITAHIGDGWIRTWRSCARSSRSPRMRSFASAGARSSARTRALAAPSRASAPACGRPGVDVRRAGQAHPRIQAPAPEHPAHDRAVSPPQSSTPAISRAPSFSAARPRPAITWPS